MRTRAGRQHSDFSPLSPLRVTVLAFSLPTHCKERIQHTSLRRGVSGCSDNTLALPEVPGMFVHCHRLWWWRSPVAALPGVGKLQTELGARRSGEIQSSFVNLLSLWNSGIRIIYILTVMIQKEYFLPEHPPD